jgi:hypothetical protein
MTPAAIAAWWDRWGLDHTAAAQQRRAAYAVQKAAAAAVMRAIVPVTVPDILTDKVSGS